MVMGNYEDTFAMRGHCSPISMTWVCGMIAERLLEMLEVEFGEKELTKGVARRAVPASESSLVDDLIPGLVMLNRVAVLVGNYGTENHHRDVDRSGGDRRRDDAADGGEGEEDWRVLFIASLVTTGDQHSEEQPCCGNRWSITTTNSSSTAGP